MLQFNFRVKLSPVLLRFLTYSGETWASFWNLLLPVCKFIFCTELEMGSSNLFICDSCGDGYFVQQVAGISACIRCPAGFACRGGIKQKCIGTTFTFGKASHCSPCYPGFVMYNFISMIPLIFSETHIRMDMFGWACKSMSRWNIY